MKFTVRQLSIIPTNNDYFVALQKIIISATQYFYRFIITVIYCILFRRV